MTLLSWPVGAKAHLQTALARISYLSRLRLPRAAQAPRGGRRASAVHVGRLSPNSPAVPARAVLHIGACCHCCCYCCCNVDPPSSQPQLAERPALLHIRLHTHFAHVACAPPQLCLLSILRVLRSRRQAARRSPFADSLMRAVIPLWLPVACKLSQATIEAQARNFRVESSPSLPQAKTR